MPLSLLPEDLLCVIMEHLDSISMQSTALTCRVLYEIFRSTRIQYIYEIGVSSMQDSGSGRPAEELLAALRDRRNAWRELNWKSVETVKAGRFFTIVEHVAGVFAQAYGQCLSVSWLPSATRHGTLATTDMGLRIRDFVIDVAQDLVIIVHEEEWTGGIVRANLYCGTISTSEPHPACSSASPMSFELRQLSNVMFSLKLEVAADVVFVTVLMGDTLRLMIWNWKTGLPIHDSLDQLSPLVYELDIVRRDVFILTSVADSGKILVYQINPMVSRAPVLIVTLSLPKKNVNVIRFTARSGQFQEHPTPGTLFMPSPTSRTHVFSFEAENRSDYMLFVRSSTFLRYVDQGCKGLEVPWSGWGERETRLMEQRREGDWRRYVHGHRVVCSSTDKPGVDVLDFSPFSTSKSSSSTSGSRVQQYFSRDDPTVISKDEGTFEEDVITCLPYHVASREVENAPHGYLIDEERIVGVTFGMDAVQLTVYSF
ncbi:hypothetical protein NLJ89_g9747 [Agrocybe chaxingu]|uniref:F-box domain-containing protein n=1 Tax=Agrocybe chaxingu TaxID=84603 RepID=A0A9W8JSZ5_9AGAR|nr:hypothetical protein NLJ89_g9747 [Agrocybe chaxingu]